LPASSQAIPEVEYRPKQDVAGSAFIQKNEHTNIQTGSELVIEKYQSFAYKCENYH
jgi:hypothetical protein